MADYSEAWRERRKRIWLALLGPVVGLLAVFALSELFYVVRAPPWITSVLITLWFIASVALGFRAGLWRCPRCGRVFTASRLLSNPLTRKCLHCGLRIGASGSEPRAT